MIFYLKNYFYCLKEYFLMIYFYIKLMRVQLLKDIYNEL